MKTAIILLAAGDGNRFGSNKLLYKIDDKNMYEHIADKLDEFPLDFFFGKVIVSQYPDILSDMRKRGFICVENTSPKLGISYSLRLGLSNIPKADAACFCVCDQPYIKASSIMNMIEGFEKSGKGIGCLSYSGEPGNPVIFSKKYFDELSALEGDSGGKRILKRHTEDVYMYETDNKKELFDIDTIKDLGARDEDNA